MYYNKDRRRHVRGSEIQSQLKSVESRCGCADQLLLYEHETTRKYISSTVSGHAMRRTRRISAATRQPRRGSQDQRTPTPISAHKACTRRRTRSAQPTASRTVCHASWAAHRTPVPASCEQPRRARARRRRPMPRAWRLILYAPVAHFRPRRLQAVPSRSSAADISTQVRMGPRASSADAAGRARPLREKRRGLRLRGESASIRGDVKTALAKPPRRRGAEGRSRTDPRAPTRCRAALPRQASGGSGPRARRRVGLRARQATRRSPSWRGSARARGRAAGAIERLSLRSKNLGRTQGRARFLRPVAHGRGMQAGRRGLDGGWRVVGGGDCMWVGEGGDCMWVVEGGELHNDGGGDRGWRELLSVRSAGREGRMTPSERERFGIARFCESATIPGQMAFRVLRCRSGTKNRSLRRPLFDSFYVP